MSKKHFISLPARKDMGGAGGRTHSVRREGTYLRVGSIPREGEHFLPSWNFRDDQPEKGVSVVDAWHDKARDKYVVKTGWENERLFRAIGAPYRTGYGFRAMMEVEGTAVGRGTDKEVLLDPATVKIRRLINPQTVVMSDVPHQTLGWETIPKGQRPNWVKPGGRKSAGGDDQPRVPAGSPDGGQWTKK